MQHNGNKPLFEKDGNRFLKLLSLSIYASLAGFILNSCGGGGTSSPQADRDNDTIIDSRDNCPNIANTDQLDTDNDTKGDVCDEDDDNDGFNDNDDPAPLDSTIPGDFSTPEAILDHALMRKSLQELHNKGFSISTEKAPNPADLTGYYTQEDSLGITISTNNDTDIGRMLTGSEIKLISLPDNHIDSSNIYFTNGKAVGYTLKKGSLIRGKNNQFTIYSRGKSICTEGGADYKMYFVGISTATLDANTKNILDIKYFSVTVDTEGNLTKTCADRWVGEAEKKGGWGFFTISLQKKIDSVDDFNYMCVDNKKAYIPTQSWLNTEGKSCTCTKDYKISCQ